jgi:hypothetical protein
MPANVTTADVWRHVEKQSFAVLGFVTPRGEARTAGIIGIAPPVDNCKRAGHASYPKSPFDS